MTDRDALLAAILAVPEDDAPRLIYADWLDEHGEHDRAAFIRIQCKIASQDCPRPMCRKDDGTVWVSGIGKYTHHCRCAYCKLRREEWNIWKHHGCDWIGDFLNPIVAFKLAECERTGRPMNADPREQPLFPEFTRGFIDSIACTASDWLTHADAILAAHPVREVTLTTWPEVAGTNKSDRYRLKGRSRTHATGRGGLIVDEIPKLLSLEWPRIKFHLPQLQPPEFQNSADSLAYTTRTLLNPV